TPETFRKNNATSKVKISKAVNKYTTSSKKAQREPQLYVNVDQSISSNVTIPVLKQDLDVTIPVLKQSRQDLNKTGVFTNSIKKSNKNIENQVQKLPNNKDKCIFYNKPPYIIAMRKIGNNNRWQSYKVIKLGYYPSISKFTPKKNGIAYQIPDKYEIETNLSGLSVKCKTEYQPTGNISYTISWVNPYGDIISSSSMTSASNAGIKFLTDICNKPNTHISGVFLFGFDIEHLHKARIKAPVNRKRSYIELESESQKNKQIALAQRL
ncbi:10979_t:CDS:2, partial [Dentiscutata erythropus]